MSFLKKIKDKIENNRGSSKIAVDQKDLQELVYHFERVDNEIRTGVVRVFYIIDNSLLTLLVKKDLLASGRLRVPLRLNSHGEKELKLVRQLNDIEYLAAFEEEELLRLKAIYKDYQSKFGFNRA